MKTGAAYHFFKILTGKLLFLLILVLPAKTHAQTGNDYAVHANIIYHFTKYIDWPQAKKKGDFIIGIVGNSSLYDEMKNSIQGKMVSDQKIVIKKISPSSSTFDCNILFIGEEESDHIKKIAAMTAGLPILLLSEEEGSAKKGSCINFVLDDHLTLEINKTNIEQRKLGIASELLQLGKIVK